MTRRKLSSNWKTVNICRLFTKYYCRLFPTALQERQKEDLALFSYEYMFTSKNFHDFNILLNDLHVNFDILAITESRIKKDSSSPENLHLDNYSIEEAPTETSALLYISKRLFYQLRKDLKLYHQGKK